MAMYEVGTVTGAASQARVTGATTKWSQVALGDTARVDSGGLPQR